MLKKIFLILLTTSGVLAPTESRSMETIAALASCCTPKVIAACAATLLGIKCLRTPDTNLKDLEDINVKTFVPVSKNAEIKNVLETAEQVKNFLKSEDTSNVAIKIDDKMYELQSGISESVKNSHEICIAAGGSLNNWEVFSAFKNCNPGGYGGYRFIKAKIIDMPCITFDCVTDKRKSFNFCQEQDLNNLDIIVKKVLSINPNVKIALAGTCKGGSLILRYLAEKSEQDNTKELSAIKAVVVEGPPNSVYDSLKNVTGYPISYGLAKMCLPNFDPNAKTILQAQKFPNIPVFIGTIPTDTVCNYDDVLAMTTHIKSLKNENLYLLTSQEKISHSSMVKLDKQFQRNARAFIDKSLGKLNDSSETKALQELESFRFEQIKKTA